MQTKRRVPFTTVRTEGAILPTDLLQRVVDRDGRLEGLKPETYHLADETLNEAVNNTWNRLTEKWRKFREVLAKLPETNPAMADTRDRWLLPLFDGLGYGRLLSSKPVMIEGKAYPLSHSWGNAPIHLVGYRVELDRRQTGPAGSDRTSPHGMLQELLNRSEQHLWGFVTNGRRLRILRDNVSLTRQAFVEFDIETMMDGGVYADFALLWLLCHQSRVESERPQDCWLERWSHAAQEQGTRALDQLRNGVEQAITALGRGFLSHRENPVLREALRSGRLVKQDYFRQLLRMVYRLIFLFVAEDRKLLHDPKAEKVTTDLYGKFYSTARVRKLAELRTGSRHGDLFAMLRLVMRKLGHDEGCPELGLSPLDSFLWSDEAMPDLIDAQISNRDLLEAIRSLCFTVDANVLRPVDFKNLGTEELGSVYESLLELHPELEADAGTFRLATAGGHERKTSGTYYTPPQLVRCLLDSALEPVLAEAASKPDPERAILDIKVCDPACGSGHFLISAGHRIAKRLASVRIGDIEPSTEDVRTALRDVIGRCLYGVDINPMTVELCKVSLWMEATVPGKPLSFLEHHIREGNSLLGTTPGLLRRGIPDEAFEPIEGDDKAICRDYRKRNKSQRLGQEEMFNAFEGKPWERQGNLAATMRNVDQMPDETLAQIRAKERAYQEAIHGGPYASNHLLADAWCAAFVWKKSKENHPEGFLEPITQATFELIAENPNKVPEATRQEIRRLADQYRFHHWHLAFSDVFSLTGHIADDDTKGWSGGFDVVLGNPPWERIKIQEQEWFAERRPDIAKAPNASARRKMIQGLAQDDPTLHRSFLEDRRSAEGESQLVRSSGRFPLCGRGDINTYSVFAELNRQLISRTGSVGCIVPSGISSDDTTKAFFQDVIKSRTMVSLYSFENEEFIFPSVHHSTKFCLMTTTGLDRPHAEADFVFFARRGEHLLDPDRHFSLSDADFALMNPNTGTCPSFRSERDAEINKTVYRRVPILVRESPTEENHWGITFLRMLDMANDSGIFRTREELESEGWVLQGNVFCKGGGTYTPLIEAKMAHHFDHRFGTYEGQTLSQSNQGKLPELNEDQHADPWMVTQPWYWVPAAQVEERLTQLWDHQWLIGWRDVCRSTDTRTVIASLLPRSGVGHKFPLLLPGKGSPSQIACLYANLTSFALDYTARQKMGGTSLSYFHLKQFPVLAPNIYASVAEWFPSCKLEDWISLRVLELTFTSWDLEPFARDCNYSGPPFVWNDKRRSLIRSELDAAYFHLYGIARDDVSYILESFPVVRKKDEARHGEYRTRKVILDIYDRMAEASLSGKSYQTLLDPPPGDASVAHPDREPTER